MNPPESRSEIRSPIQSGSRTGIQARKNAFRPRSKPNRASRCSPPAWAAGLVLALACSVAPAADGWLTDYEQALATAAATGRPILAVFTGSDWCAHCRSLENQVLSSSTFQNWARDRVVLAMIDLPRQGISPDIRRTRSQVCSRYGVRAFPSVVLAAPDGTKIALQVGYRGETPATWINGLEALLPTDLMPQASAGVVATLSDAVARSRTAGKPVLVMVSRAGNTTAEAAVRSLIEDPDFKALAEESFVVATVPHPTGELENAEVGPLFDGIVLADEEVGIVVTEDGKTPLFSHSGQEPPHGIVHGLRRFLASLKPRRR